jgi:ABC-type branched-subunit amino acid transport system permease subunit
MSLVIAMAVLGGMESMFGAAVGAIVSRIALELLRQINILGLKLDLGTWRYAIFGLLLVFTLRFAQNGLIYPIVDRLFMRPARQATVAKRQVDKEGRTK